eukprot:5823871-Amphidinium_carterae.1
MFLPSFCELLIDSSQNLQKNYYKAGQRYKSPIHSGTHSLALDGGFSRSYAAHSLYESNTPYGPFTPKPKRPKLAAASSY